MHYKVRSSLPTQGVPGLVGQPEACQDADGTTAEIKLVMAAVYTNFTTSIVDDEGIEQDHAFISLPKGRKLVLRFSSKKQVESTV